MTPPSAGPSVIPQIGKQQPFHTLQIWIKLPGGPTCGTCLSILTNHTHSQCLSKRKGPSEHPPPYFLNNPLEEVFHSSFWESLFAMIFPGKATFANWPPKSVWASSVVQSPFLAHLIFWPHTKLSATAQWSTALHSEPVLPPLTFFRFTLCKPRHLGSLVSLALRPSLWVCRGSFGTPWNRKDLKISVEVVYWRMKQKEHTRAWKRCLLRIPSSLSLHIRLHRGNM